MSLRELRLKRGLTQKQLADKLGYTRERIAAIETGARPIGGVSLDKAIEICDVLRVSNPRKLLEAEKPNVLLQCLFDRFGSVFPQCGLMVFPGVVIVSR